MKKQRKYSWLHIGMLLTILILAACSSVDCPLNNTVYANYKLMGKVTTLPDMLTISTTRQDGSDSILINRQDTLYFQTNTLIDTVWIEKTNHPHFESVDCGLNYFHTITGVSCTHNAIDSIVINKKEVTYDISQQHFYIYFKFIILSIFPKCPYK